MFLFRLLPWEYAIRNLFRRPLRTALTFFALTMVILMVFVVVGFVRGLEASLAVSGDPQTALIFSLGMGENLEYSSISSSTNDLVAASVEGIQERYGKKYVSPELYLGTDITVAGHDEPEMGLVRGVTPAVLLVRRQVELEEGAWPGPGEVMVGRLAATKLGAADFIQKPFSVSGLLGSIARALEGDTAGPQVPNGLSSSSGQSRILTASPA